MKNGYFIGKINPTFSDTPISDAFWYPKTCRQTLIRFDRHFHEAAGERQINTLKQLIASDLPRGGDLWAIYLTLFTPQFVGVWRVWVINGTGWFNAKIFQPFISVHPLIPEVWAIPAMFLIAWWWSPPSIERYICIFPSILKLSPSSEVPILPVIESYIVCYPQTLKTVNF